MLTNMPIAQVHFVPDPGTAVVTYSRVRWYRATTRDGAYEAITAPAAAPAQVIAGDGPFLLNGKSLILLIDGVTELEITFSGSNPFSTSTVCAAINAAGTGEVTADDDDGPVVISTVATGIASSIEVLASEAAPYLGLYVGQEAHGLNAHSVLASGTYDYVLTDAQGDVDHWYQSELWHHSTGATSARSAAQPSQLPDSPPPSSTVACYIRLVGLDGRPMRSHQVTLHNQFIPNRLTVGATTWGAFRNAVDLRTDDSGYAMTRVIKGATIDLNVAGTGFTRRLTVPEAATSVDLLDPDLVTSDEFGIQELDIPFAVRTS